MSDERELREALEAAQARIRAVQLQLDEERERKLDESPKTELVRARLEIERLKGSITATRASEAERERDLESIAALKRDLERERDLTGKLRSELADRPRAPQPQLKGTDELNLRREITALRNELGRINAERRAPRKSVPGPVVSKTSFALGVLSFLSFLLGIASSAGPVGMSSFWMHNAVVFLIAFIVALLFKR